jgi:hypothetical protein
MRRLAVGIALGALIPLSACGSSSGTPATSPSPASSASAATAGGGSVDLAAGYDGTYHGTWTNTTFGSRGSASFVVSTDRTAKKTSIVVTLGGNVFGAGVAPETITGDITDAGFSFTGHSTIFGDVSVFTIAPDGTLALTATNTSPRVTKFVASGKVTKNLFTLAYVATLSSGPANGTITVGR